MVRDVGSCNQAFHKEIMFVNLLHSIGFVFWVWPTYLVSQRLLRLQLGKINLCYSEGILLVLDHGLVTSTRSFSPISLIITKAKRSSSRKGKDTLW